MKKFLKISLIYCILILTMFTYNITRVNAATGTLSISSPSSTTIGNTFSVTVKASGSKIFYWQLYVSYDTSKLKLVSGNTTIQGEADDATNGTGSVSQTLKFQATKTGTAAISVAMGDASMNIDANFNTINYAKKTVNVSIVSPIPKSTNNNLSSLSIDGINLSPTFSKDTLEYSVELENNIKSINIAAKAEDSKALITGAGAVAVVEGSNSINIVVTAESGDTKTYKINANVKELAPVEVKINNIVYTIVRKKDLYQVPKNFEETTIKVNEEDVLAYINKKINYTIVGLKDKDGKINTYVYDDKNKSYTPYNEFLSAPTTLYLFKPDNKIKVPDGYKQTSLKINDIKVDAWQLKDTKKKDFYLVYGINVENGKTGFYQYDSIDKTFQRFEDNQLTSLQKNLNQYFIIIIVTASICLGLIGLLLYQLKKQSKQKRSH